jgi:imidazolonepropionase
VTNLTERTEEIQQNIPASGGKILWNYSMLIHSASQLLTLAGDPQRGGDLGRLEIIPDGAVLIEGDQIAAVGTSAALKADYPNEPELDAGGKVVLPGFVDPHTHAIWAGDRAAEFDLRLQGASYLDILAAGGGILSTVRATRTSTLDRLIAETRPRLWSMFLHGTTTAEVKTGYGLRTATELRMLQGLLALQKEGPLEIAPTFLGAHAIAPEFRDDPQGYVELINGIMLPLLCEWWPAHAPDQALPFVDVFCETGAFSLEQSRSILGKAKDCGFPLKIHADEFDNLGGASLAAELGAVSADHLVKTSAQDIEVLGRSNTVAVGLPCTPFGLAETEYTPARHILEAGGLLALATDLNPGTAWCGNMQFAIALACRYMKLTPAQAIAAATINAAAAISAADRLGSLEAGKQGDLIILSVDDYRHLGYRFGTNLVQSVIKKGRVYPV